ncbi:ABC transporter ATP-binding protein [Roseomonas nepalensis]|uniref:ABC transporter ATP-binding protein n=1 Tax=Muricoccus nepalensis TaxID=1854500 RepID=A0A502G7N2_9PROT|nr:ABC transporter ATP-binding protein [Roseomonas nepalensis]TPG58127.1 ABC transporter ATP-binding protein [Roseomonas nepalensis]
MARRLVSFGTEGTVFHREPARPAPQPAMPAAMAMAVLTLDGVRKAGRGEAPPVLAGMDLAVARGEILGLLGPAGAGKSAVIDLAAGFLAPDAGAVLIKGERTAGLPAWKRDIGLVSAGADLFPDMTVLGNAAFPLEARGVARGEREERAAAMLARWGVPAALHPGPVGGLAPALRVRVALARALVHAPALLLLDDALGTLDGAAREALVADLLRVRAELGLTVLHATRDAALALTLSDRVAVMEGGRLLQAGAPRDLYDRPADPVVAAMTGPCNRLPGKVLAVEGGSCHVQLDCGLEAVGVPVAGAGGGPARGGRCVLLIRPERVAVAPVPPAEMGEDAVAARLIEARFAGDHLRLRLAIGEGAELLCHRPAGLPLPEPGEEASIAWDLGAARVHAA